MSEPVLSDPVLPDPVLPAINGWRRTIRTVFQALIGVASTAPVVYWAVTQQSPEAATGAAAQVLVVTGAITRVMAVPQVEEWLQRFVPWLAASPRDPGVAVDEDDDDLPPLPDDDLLPDPTRFANGV